MRRYLFFISILILPATSAIGQLSQLIYLKTFPSNASPLESFHQSSKTYGIGIFGPEVDASIFPFQSPVYVSTQLENGATHISYNPNLEVASSFETQKGYGILESLFNQSDVLIYSQHNPTVAPTNLFSSSPAVSDVNTSSILASTFLLTYNPATNTLKMPFHCSCFGYQGEDAQSHILLHFSDYQMGLRNSYVGRYNAAWMSDSTVVMAFNVFSDVTLNWEDNFPIGDNYWGTFWVKINPFNGTYIATSMLSQNGSAINFNLNGTPDGDYLYRTGTVRGNGVQMSPDGTTWDTFEGDSLYYAYVIKENSVGEQSWMSRLFSYQNKASDLSGGANLQFWPSKVLEMNSDAYLGSFIRVYLNPQSQGDTLFYNDYMSPVDTLVYTGLFPQQMMVSTQEITRFDENGEIVARRFFPNRNPDANDFSQLSWSLQLPELFKVNDKLGWPFTYNAMSDTTLYFLRKYPNGSLDSTGVDLPAGRGTFLLWLDADLSIVDVMNIPFSTGDNPFAFGLSIREVSLYHQDSLMISGNIKSGTTTTMDPEGVAASISYDSNRSFVAFYSLPNYLTGVESLAHVKNDRVQLFPNPAKDQITVQTDYPFPVGYSVVDIMGHKLAQGEIPISEKRHRISVSDFDPGIYLLVLKKNRELLVTRKFMVY